MKHGNSAEWLFVHAGYPIAISIGIALYLALLSNGTAPAVCAYASISLVLPIILTHEHLFPHQKIWGVTAQAFKLDATYLILIQIAFASAVKLLGVWLLSDLLSAPQRTLDVWPTQWPILAQFLIMTFASEFLGYWLHRAAHNSRILWRFHSIHHSSTSLYWLAVCRSHPGEVFMQVIFIAFPFLILGAQNEVIFLYLVFVCVNGFYQHSNCELRLGKLNYLVSGPEVHRWHHSRVRQESDTNFGTNLIVWDVLFGTRLLPEGDTVRELGLSGTNQPLTFWEQLVRPFMR